MILFFNEYGDGICCCPNCEEVFSFPLGWKEESYPCRHCGQEIWTKKENF